MVLLSRTTKGYVSHFYLTKLLTLFYIQVVAVYQVRFEEMKTRIIQLELKVNAYATVAKPRKVKKALETPTRLLKLEETICSLARRYCLTNCPWIDPRAFDYKARPEIDLNADGCYDTEKSRQLTEAAELWDLLASNEEVRRYLGKQTDFIKDTVCFFFIIPE